MTDGVVLIKVSEQYKMKLSKLFKIRPFQTATRTIKKWLQIPVDEKSDIEKIISFIKNSYNQSKFNK